MIERALTYWSLGQMELLLIENVGNLICPSSYDLGEEAKIVLLSVTEGEDKPLKYPSIFAKSDLLVITKIDLLPHVPFRMEDARANARLVHPGIEIIELSCATGEGLDTWLSGYRNAAKPYRDTPARHRCNVQARKRICVSGIVQGVGFWPTAYRLAHRYGLSGYERNTVFGGGCVWANHSSRSAPQSVHPNPQAAIYSEEALAKPNCRRRLNGKASPELQESGS